MLIRILLLIGALNHLTACIAWPRPKEVVQHIDFSYEYDRQMTGSGDLIFPGDIAASS